MSDRIRNTPELLERYEGEALALREHQLQQNISSPLGPLDFCVVRKAFDQIYLPEVIRSAPLRTCAYHSVAGLDTSSTAGVAAYFSELVNQQEPQGWLSTGVWRIEGGIFCAYDCFSKCEVRMDISIPGTVTCHAISASGSCEKMTPAIWKGVWVSSVLRSFGFVRSNRVRSIHWQTVRVLDAFQKPMEESEFLDAAREFFLSGASLGCEDVILPADNVNNRMVSSILDYFFDMHRYSQAIAFFASLLQEEPLLAIPLALAHNKLGETNYALSLLSDAARRETDYVPLLLTQSELLLASSQVGFAKVVAKRVVELEPLLSKGWLLLARAYAADEEFANALVCLNMALYEKGSAVFEAKRQDSFGCGRSAERSAENAAFDVLVDIANQTGWQGLLDLRSDVFLMEPETAFSEEFGGPCDDEGLLDTGTDRERMEQSLVTPGDAEEVLDVSAEPADSRPSDPLSVRESGVSTASGGIEKANERGADRSAGVCPTPEEVTGSDTDDRGAENGSGYEQDTENPNDGTMERVPNSATERVARSRADPALRTSVRAGGQSRGRESGYESSEDEVEPFRIVRIQKKKQRSPTIRATATASVSTSTPRPGRSRAAWNGGVEGQREMEVGEMELPGTGETRAPVSPTCTPVAPEMPRSFPVLYSPLLRSPPPSFIPQASVADRVGSTPRPSTSDDPDEPAQLATSTSLAGAVENETVPLKRLCGVGLEGIFLSLFHDLREFSLWVDDQRRQFSAHQLLRFGALAERLKAYNEALFAYCECVRQIRAQMEAGGEERGGDARSADSGLIAAYEGWLRVCVETKELRDSLVVLDSLVRLLFPPGSVPVTAEITFSVTSAVCSLLEAYGSGALLAHQARIGPLHPVVQSFLKACGVWEVKGYEK